MYALKIYRRVMVITMKNDARFEKKFTRQFKTDMKNLINLDPSTQ